MWGDTYQPLMNKLVQDALVKICTENLPSRGSNLEINAIVCISSGKGSGNRIVVKLNKTVETKKSWHEPNERSPSPWKSTPNNIFRSINESSEDGPVDLTGSRDSRSILKYTSENISNVTKNGAKETGIQSNCNSALESAEKNGAIYRGPLPVPRVDDNNVSRPNVLNKLNKLQPPNYKPLPHMKLDQTSSKTEVDVKGNTNGIDQSVATLQCKSCEKFIEGGFAQLQAHVQAVHRRYVCRYCQNTFTLRCNLKRHERLHIGVKPYMCTICEKSFARSTDLRQHMHKHGMSDNDVGVPCPKCPRTFLSTQSQRWHLFKVHKITESKFVCSTCEKLFLDQDEYMKHREEEHAGSLADASLIKNETVDSQEYMEFGQDNLVDDEADSEPGNLLIDTQSDEETMDSVCNEVDMPIEHAAQETNAEDFSQDLGYELVNEVENDFSKTGFENMKADENNSSKTGSRKKKKVPTATLR